MLAEARTLVVVPSISFPVAELVKIAGVQFYEQRMLVAALLLRRPDVRIVFCTSTRVDPVIVDYYLGLLPDPDDARRRLHLFDAGDPSIGSLSAKLLRQPAVLEELRAVTGGGADAFLLPFNVTELERQLADALGVSLYGPRPDLVRLGSKTGSREVARRAGVAVLPGRERLFSLEEIARAIADIRAESPSAGAVMIKLNNGFSGQGNAIVDLAGDGSLTERSTIFCGTGESWPSYEPKIGAEGAIVEELLPDGSSVSPSVQLHIGPQGDVDVVSTHEQILGGPENKVYVGCRFPAGEAYRRTIQEEALKVAGVLSSEGVIGWFGIDFLVVPPSPDDRRTVYLSEINLRLGGTTHPFWMARLITDGVYEQATGNLLVDGRPKSYVASDNLKSERLVGRSPAEVIDAVERAGLGYRPDSRTGTTLHLLGALPGHGKMGVTCIGDGPDEAGELYREVELLLL